jgi:glycosyltransferase involved in cell wall biosynthesis
MISRPVSVLLPVLDEVAEIDACLASLVDQKYDGPLEIVVADGGSTDGTRPRLRQWAARDPRVVLIDNPRRRQSHGLNLSARVATGEILVRADAHTTYAPDYVERSVAVLAETGAVAVGGRLRPVGRTPTGQAIAAALRSPLGVGPARFHHAERREVVDTVYLGAFRRAEFLAHGGFRTLPSGVAEDADLYWRWRRSGRTVVVDPSIRSTYRPRGTLPAFARQNWRYGLGKAEMLWVNGVLPSWRPLAPLALVAGLGGTGLLAARGRRGPLVALTGAWAAVATAAALRAREPGLTARTAAAVATMHVSYGAGLAYGLLRGPGPLRHLR